MDWKNLFLKILQSVWAGVKILFRVLVIAPLIHVLRGAGQGLEQLVRIVAPWAFAGLGIYAGLVYVPELIHAILTLMVVAYGFRLIIKGSSQKKKKRS